VDTPGIDLEELRYAIRERLSAEKASRILHVDGTKRSGVDRELLSEVAALGWLAMSVPEQYGGLGLTFAEVGVLFEEVGRHPVRLPIFSMMLAAHALAAFGQEQQKAEWLSAISGGKVIAAVALPPDNSPQPEELMIDSKGVVTGVASHVLFANCADLILLAARDANDRFVLVMVTPDQQGVSIDCKPTIDLTRDLCAVKLNEVQILPHRRLQLSPSEWDELSDFASVALACDAVGGALYILEQTVDYLCTRVQFERAIGSFQALKHRAATWKILLEAASAFTRHAAGLLATGVPGKSMAASSAKFYACDAFASIAGDAVQLHGGIGFTWEHECHLYLKRAKLNQVLFGSSTRHRDRVADLILSDFLTAGTEGNSVAPAVTACAR